MTYPIDFAEPPPEPENDPPEPASEPTSSRPPKKREVTLRQFNWAKPKPKKDEDAD